MVNVFSVTKGVTAICAARLIDEGKLDPNQLVSYYWPEYNCNGKGKPKLVIFYVTELACLDLKVEFPLVHFKIGTCL